ncbi:hypothetical protein D3C87_1493850 [compost metagenome]
MGHARLGNRHRESTEQRVGQRHRRPAAEATVEGFQRRFDPQATGQTTHQRTNDQRDHHMHAGQAEYQHDANRGNYCIHFITSTQTERVRSAASMGRQRIDVWVLLEGAHCEGSSGKLQPSSQCVFHWQLAAGNSRKLLSSRYSAKSQIFIE